MPDIVLRVAAKAVIVNKSGKVLIVREAATYAEGTHHGRYGLPGGRLELGESFEDGLRREVYEEVGLEIEPLYPLSIGEWHPTVKGIPHQIIAVFVVCKAKTTKTRLSEEHDLAKWINPTDYPKYDLMNGEVLDAYLARHQ